MSFDPALPKPYKENWREAYRYDENSIPRLSTYQAPGEEPVPFVFDTVRLSGGQSVDTAEYPFFGFWSNTPLNEKPQTITVNGFVRGDSYIKNRNALIEALRVRTDDDTPGFLDLPLWGRFPVVVTSCDIEEKGRENGQCSVSITLTRAGVTTEERWKFEGGGFDFYGKTEAEAEKLKEEAIGSFDRELKDNADPGVLASAFGKFKEDLVGVIGRIQGAESALSAMTNEVTGITSLIAQGIRSPRELAQALFSAAGSIVTGVMEIKNSAAGVISYFRTRDNIAHTLMQFLSKSNYRVNTAAVTVKQMTSGKEAENVYRTMSLYAAGMIMARLENPTRRQAKNYWALYEKLEAGVDQSDPAMYRAIQNLRIAAARELAARSLDAELTRHINAPAPLLYLAHYLGCDDEKLRALNRPADSFVMRGDVIYV
ncbi:MAG: DNA circularization N-terminal domain-containing protein [Treponema sp.]|jgi:prophage DNA circulation protein|nr:DNA circularization N-terminal domain-containing protein [Treponema sp.]